MAAGDVDVQLTSNGFRSACRFDGVDDYVEVSKSYAGENDTISVSFWAKSRVTDYTSNSYPVGCFNTVGNKRMWGFYINSSDDKWAIRVSSNGTTTDGTVTSKAVELGWHHLCFVCTSNASKTWKFYYDGAFIENITVPYTFTNTGSMLAIGSNVGTNSFNGSVYNVRIYNKVLSAAEILQLYQGTPVTDKLAGFWPLKSDYLDYSEWGNNGTNHSSVFVTMDASTETVMKAQRAATGATYTPVVVAVGGQIISAFIDE